MKQIDFDRIERKVKKSKLLRDRFYEANEIA